MKNSLSLDFSLGQIKKLEAQFGDYLSIEILMPSINAEGKPVAKHMLITFQATQATKIDINSVPWLEITKPITTSRVSRRFYEEARNNGLQLDETKVFLKYILTTDAGTIEVVAEGVDIDLIEELPRSCE